MPMKDSIKRDEMTQGTIWSTFNYFYKLEQVIIW